MLQRALDLVPERRRQWQAVTTAPGAAHRRAVARRVLVRRATIGGSTGFARRWAARFHAGCAVGSTPGAGAGWAVAC